MIEILGGGDRYNYFYACRIGIFILQYYYSSIVVVEYPVYEV